MIDAHQHFWTLSRGDYDWLTPALTALHRDFGPDDIALILAQAGIRGTIIVQAAATEAETRHCFAIARCWPTALGVVGWVDFDDPAMPAALDRLLADSGGLMKGLRPMIQDMTDVDWVASPRLDTAFAAVKARDLVFDALVGVQHLPALHNRLERSPGLRCVIDHAAKPAIATRAFENWAHEMTALAARPNVVAVKLSGLLTEAAPGDGIDALRPYVDHLTSTFGADRLIWGSDWPVLTLAVDYRHWLDMALALTASLGPVAQSAIFGGNAVRIYRLDTEWPR